MDDRIKNALNSEKGKTVRDVGTMFAAGAAGTYAHTKALNRFGEGKLAHGIGLGAGLLGDLAASKINRGIDKHLAKQAGDNRYLQKIAGLKGPDIEFVKRVGKKIGPPLVKNIADTGLYGLAGVGAGALYSLKTGQLVRAPKKDFTNN